jgi:hypothetical protein
MENEDNLFNQLNPYANPYGAYSTSGNAVDPNNFDNPYNRSIEIPKTFKDVVVKMFPEIQDVVSSGYRETAMYCPDTFDAIKKYLVGVDLYFNDKYSMKKSKKEYSDELTNYLKMTYGELDFVTLHVRSFIFPPEKSNEDKFFEVFGKSEK